jgi:hypothetical protein
MRRWRSGLEVSWATPGAAVPIPASRSASPPREPPSPKTGGMMSHRLAQYPILFSGQPPSFSRRVGARVIRPMRSRNKSEGARDAARSNGPAEIPEKTRKSAFSPASRARCLCGSGDSTALASIPGTAPSPRFPHRFWDLQGRKRGIVGAPCRAPSSAAVKTTPPVSEAAVEIVVAGVAGTTISG